jgi:hypothetical protein
LTETDRTHVGFFPFFSSQNLLICTHALLASQVIKGWDEGVMKMSLGEKAILRITSDYGYGR